MGNVKNKQKRGEEMSVFYRDIDVKISDYKSELSKPLVIFERDRGLEIYFNLVEYAYRLDKNPKNLLENLVGAYATVTLVNPDGYEISVNEVEITEEAKVKFVITEDLTDELTEIGIYQLQIHVNNDVEGRDTSVFSVPPFNFEVRERLKGRKNELLDSEGNGLTDKEGYQLVSATSNKTINFSADKINEYLNSIPTIQGKIKDLNSQLDNNAKELDLLSKYKTYKSIKEYGAISDCNYYNASDNKYYKDSNYTQLATYNDEAFLNAFNSGYNIIIDDGNFLLKNTIVLKKAINIIAKNGNIYMESNEGTKGIKHIFQLENEIKIDGVKFNSKNNQQLEMSLREENGSSWDESHGYSSNISAINIKNSNCEVSNCVGTELEFLVHANNSSVINNLKINNNSIYKTFIGIGMGNVINSYIESNTITMESSLGVGTPHAIYFWGGCQNIRVSNCYLYNSANIISLMRSRGSNYKIMISNCSFECLKTKNSIGIDCVNGTSNVYIQNCTFTDCRGLLNSSAIGSSYINNCMFISDNNIANNTISNFINPLENTGGGLLNVENTTFDITFYYENAIKFKNTKFRNVNLILTVNNSINTFNKTAIETDGDVRFYNSSIISNGRYYVYGSGTYSIYNSVITSSQGSELSYLNTNYYKCIMSNSFTNTNNMTNMVDCTLI